MKSDFRSQPFGYKILFIWIILTFLSMLLPWGTEIIRVSGQFRFRWEVSPFRNGEFLILLPYLYHLGMIFTGRTMNRWIALVLALTPVIGLFLIETNREYPYDYDSEIGFSLFSIFSIITVIGMLIGLIITLFRMLLGRMLIGLKHSTKDLRNPFKSGGNE